MSNQLQKVKNNGVQAQPADLKASKDRILHFHDSCLRAAQNHVGYAFLAGLELNRVKEALPHGEFMAWRANNVPEIPERTTQRYMSFFAALAEKSATVADFTPDRLQLTDGSLRDEDRKVILEAVHEATDGKALTELYRDLGVIRPPKPKEYHPPKPRTPEEELEARTEHSRALLASIIEPMGLITDEDFSFLKRNEWKDALRESVTFTNRLRALLKTSKASTKKKRR